MKSIQKILLTSLLAIAMGLVVGGCAGGYVEGGGTVVVDGGGYYGPWYHEGPWLGGPRGYVGVGVHPGHWHR